MPEDDKTNRSVADRREIRVFISSTFRDMQEEREELVKQIFPQLRRLCENRGVTWGEVDLRWGVPDEAKAEGKVLPLCLQEIEHCRPYFIGLLGERYGWVPEEIPESLFETQPWLSEHLHQSVTALEILHGVLRNPDMEKHAFFYFRDPAYAAAHPGFMEEDSALRERLVKLKDDIRKSGFPVSEPFVTPKQLGEWVLRDLTAVIEELYPEKSIPSALDRDAADHEAYSTSRRTVYIGRQEYIDRLDAHAAGDGPPLVITGESGGGKSALLANWTHNWSEQHAGTPVLVHFIGAAPDSANWMAMLRRLLGEFQRKFGIQVEIPDQPDALRMALANALHMVAARGRLVLVLDALNQIEDRDGAPDLVWLPPVIPANVRLIVSTLPGRPWEDLKKRDWPAMTVEPLTVPEREDLTVKYLKRYSKELGPEAAHRIADAPQTGNGLYLSTLLNELRQFGSHEQLGERIDWYLQSASLVELFRKVLQRWEQDYGQPDPACENIVRESLVRLWAAHRGLSETELLESLGAENSSLPRVFWSPLYLAAGDALVNRAGLLTFAHDFLREAVRGAYLPTERDQQCAHRSLATYFSSDPELFVRQYFRDSDALKSTREDLADGEPGAIFSGRTPIPRQMDELPWQWQKAADWQALADLLARPGFFALLWGKDRSQVKIYWSQIEAESSLRMEKVYDRVIEQPTREAIHVWAIYASEVAALLDETGKPEAAMRIRRCLVEHSRRQGDLVMLQASLGGLASLLQDRGNLDGAMTMYREEEGICRKLGDKDGLSRSLGRQATVLQIRGDLDGAMTLNGEVERLNRELGSMDGLSNVLNDQAVILEARGDLDDAMRLQKQCETIFRELGNMNGLANSFTNQGRILRIRGDLNGAMALQKQAERLFRELGNKMGLSIALGNQAVILRDRQDQTGAMALHKESEHLCRDLNYKNGLQSSLAGQASILFDSGDMEGAMRLAGESEQLCRELGNKDGLQACLNIEAVILGDRGDFDGALATHMEVERLCRELENNKSLAISLGNQGSLLYRRGDLNGAIDRYKAQEGILRKQDNFEGLTISLVLQAWITTQTSVPNRCDEALRIVDEAIAIATQHKLLKLFPEIRSVLDAIDSIPEGKQDPPL